MERDLASQATYIASGHRRVPGWAARLELELFASIDDVHQARAVTGDLLEIGCYMGQTAVLLGYFRRGDERLTVCDLFSADAPDGANTWENQVSYESLTEQGFRQQFARFHPYPPEILACPSVELSGRLPGRSFRIIHVDGSHLFDVVEHDLALTAAFQAPDGVVIFDDICSSHTPGVPAAVWHAVGSADLHPLVCSTKLYATWQRTDLHERWLQLVEQRFQVSEQTIHGERVLIPHPSSARSVLQRAAEVSPASALATVRLAARRMTSRTIRRSHRSR